MSGTTGGQVLIVDDDRAVGTVLQGLLRQAGHEAAFVLSAEEALARVASRPVDLVLTDLRMPSMDGMELLEALKERAPEIPVVMLTAHGSVETAVEAMKKGAADFLRKPFDRDEVLFTVDKALLRSEHAQQQPAGPPPPAAERPWLGDSAAMEEVGDLIARAAKTTSTVLLRGESGSGKEVAARAIHAMSDRADGPFVPVHCAALPESLLESELFGYEKGAFTGASNRKPGRVELADGGTLFLDEIGDVSGSVQVKLLRLLQEKEYQRLGGTEALNADVRFVAATHRDLDEMVEEGAFREDLYYRLNVIPIWVPPLRERRADIGPLAERFCRELATTQGRPELTLGEDALERLRALDWPGNVRELSNFVERLVVFVDGDRIAAEDVERELSRQPRRRRASAPRAAGETLDARREEAERSAIVEALERAGGNRTQAARLLGISRRTLYNKLAELNLGDAD
ncbi:MAG TPA: sigma-54 dependent transcriptional regulator [Sandaracinaceae bacterium LLY-WYZ-13_1]|nr:sigma-54 dependent transcriptional regulator [Sandaracinaceae bacterium LLY-WYZ-13_1]